jgi:hypothetical protein
MAGMQNGVSEEQSLALKSTEYEPDVVDKRNYIGERLRFFMTHGIQPIRTETQRSSPWLVRR